MRNRILGGIGAIWGGGMLLNAFLSGGPQGSGAYAVGQVVGLVAGAALLVVGLYHLLKKAPAK